MTIPQFLLQADRDQLFSDWGIPATLERIIQTYDPASGLQAEAIESITLTVVPGDRQSNPSTSTAAFRQQNQHTFLVRDSELPAHLAWGSCRLASQGDTFRIVSVMQDARQGTTLLSCQKIHTPLQAG